MWQKGLFIVIEGTDGSGKGTQTKLLVDKLRKNGREVEIADFPQYGKKSAAMVEEYLNGKFGGPEDVTPYQASTFYAIDRYAASFNIRKWLTEWKIVISNRYVSANMGHQAGKIKDLVERDKFLDWLDKFEYGLFNLPRPDETIFLYMDPEIWQQLVDHKSQKERKYAYGQKRDIHERDLNHLKNASEAYRYVAKKYNWVTIECAPDLNLRMIEDIKNEIWSVVKKLVKL